MENEGDTASAIFKERLKQARETRGMSQHEVAKRAGLPASSISHFESGGRRPSFDNLRRLANALTVSTDYLLGRTEVASTEVLSGHASTSDAAPNVAAQKIYRNLERLTAYDLEIAEQFIGMLAKKDKELKPE